MVKFIGDQQHTAGAITGRFRFRGPCPLRAERSPLRPSKMAGKSKARCVHLPLSQLTNINAHSTSTTKQNKMNLKKIKIARSSSASSLPRKPASSTPRSVLGWVPSSRRSSMIREVRVCHRPISRRPALFFVGLPLFLCSLLSSPFSVSVTVGRKVVFATPTCVYLIYVFNSFVHFPPLFPQ